MSSLCIRSGLPHQELAKAMAEGRRERIKELVTMGIVIPATQWDHSISSVNALAGHQMLMNVLFTVQKEIEDKVG